MVLLPVMTIVRVKLTNKGSLCSCVDELVCPDIQAGEALDLATCLIATISLPERMLAVSMVTMVCD